MVISVEPFHVVRRFCIKKTKNSQNTGARADPEFDTDDSDLESESNCHSQPLAAREATHAARLLDAGKTGKSIPSQQAAGSTVAVTDIDVALPVVAIKLVLLTR